ncbi:MAG: rod shape-determining protein MreD [Actinobacteria bacterium]|nr:rod shape-determining protein MreD [Actinomycetota bacterium]
MRRTRIVAAIAAIITALLLQATLIAPVTSPYPVSLPAVLVAAIALMDGPATGMSIGFAAGLAADLGSRHPAGILALCWLGVGLLCGLVADRRSIRRDALTAGIVCGLASGVATVLLVVVHNGATLRSAALYTGPALLGDVVLALGLVPLVRRMLRTDSLRAPQPVYTELALGPRRG